MKKVAKQVVAVIDSTEPKTSDIKFDSIQKVTSSGKFSTKFRKSLDTIVEKSDESLYTTALEDV